MKKKIILLLVIFFCLSSTGCTKKSNDEKKDLLDNKYTNKFECSRKESLQKKQVFYMTKEEALEDALDDEEAINITYIRSYDFNKKGDKLLAYYDITEYKYNIKYDMEKQKKFYEDECSKKDTEVYKNCNVTLNNDTITVISEVNLDAEESKSWLSNQTISSLKENYESSPYTCK